MSAPSQILLGTVAIEPARWDTPNESEGGAAPRPPIRLSQWMDRIAAAGFDGIELWERHLLEADPNGSKVIVEHELPIVVWNSYVSFDEDDPTERIAIRQHASAVGAEAIKFNVGNDAKQLGAYAQRIGSWLEELPDPVRLLCECHSDISIAEDPPVAAKIFELAGPPSRVQAIVHTHESDDHLRARFDAYGDRITHVHVNFVDFDAMTAAPLDSLLDRLVNKVDLLKTLGFFGTWTIEFCHGLMTPQDRPEFLIQQAADDLVVLRSTLAEVCP